MGLTRWQVERYKWKIADIVYRDLKEKKRKKKRLEDKSHVSIVVHVNAKRWTLNAEHSQPTNEWMKNKQSRQRQIFKMEIFHVGCACCLVNIAYALEKENFHSHSQFDMKDARYS